MTILACLIPVMIGGYPNIAGMSGDLLKEKDGYYLVDFTNASKAIEGLQNFTSKMWVFKSDCIKEIR